MLDPYPIDPFTRPVRGEVTLPGSKSITNRALLLTALCDAPVTLTNALFSEDTEIMAKALNALGIKVTSDPAAKTMQATGQGGKIPVDSVELFVGNAGTAARFLTALCAAAPRGVFKLDGVPQMRKRPMKGLVDALRTLGADIRCPGEEGFFPIEIHARGLRGGPVRIDAGESSQMLSALLMVAPLCRAPLEATLIGAVRWPFVQLTARLMEAFGQPAIARPDRTVVRAASGRPYALPGGTYAIEPDATAASYFLALPLATGGSVDLPGLDVSAGGLQGDTRFADVLKQAGLMLGSPTLLPGVQAAFATSSARRGVTQDFKDFSDTFLTLAAIAPLLAGPTRITGIAHTRKQETDRVAGAARELRRLGQEVVEEEDTLTITPRPLAPGVEIETYNDHRFAMSFAILGCHDLHGTGQPWLRIRNPACCAKTFPDFFEILDRVREYSHSVRS
ncbi:MAG: 3-phosphoshikimate 1-carboxyvinyltransferase [Opitutaceae bacterium]|nr:3-phosphoshikimate 1-carboxyvinyltransferase [Opitutaceae bacterium]